MFKWKDLNKVAFCVDFSVPEFLFYASRCFIYPPEFKGIES